LAQLQASKKAETTLSPQVKKDAAKIVQYKKKIDNLSNKHKKDSKVKEADRKVDMDAAAAAKEIKKQNTVLTKVIALRSAKITKKKNAKLANLKKIARSDTAKAVKQAGTAEAKLMHKATKDTKIDALKIKQKQAANKASLKKEKAAKARLQLILKKEKAKVAALKAKALRMTKKTVKLAGKAEKKLLEKTKKIEMKNAKKNAHAILAKAAIQVKKIKARKAAHKIKAAEHARKLKLAADLKAKKAAANQAKLIGKFAKHNAKSAKK